MTPFKLAGRLVEPALNRADNNQVEPKVMQVLVALASRPGEVVTRDELMASVWSGVFVTDDVLNRAIREIRRLFGDDAENPRVVETIRKRGYRLIATIELAQQQAPPAENSVTPRHAGRWTPAGLAIAGLLLVATAGAAVVWITVNRGGTVTTEAHIRFVPLTTDPGNEIDPALSPDGSRLAYVARGADGQGRIFIKPTSTGTAVQVTRGDGRETAPAWAPDGLHLAFAHVQGDACAIRVIDASGVFVREVGRCGQRSSLKMSWSADGSALAITARPAESAPSRIEVVDIRSGAHRPLTDPPRGIVGDDSPAFSPDGKALAFVRSISGAIGDIFVVDLARGEPVQVTHDNGDVIGVEWQPDGSHLVFSSDRGGGIDLFRVAVAGGEPVLLAGGSAKLKHPSVARSGAIAYENWHYDINIVDVSIGGHTVRPLSPTTDQWNFHPQISPDGSHVAFQSTRSGRYEIWIANRDGTTPTMLTASGGYKSMPRWSPDGRTLVFVVRSAARAELTVVDVASRTARTVLTESTAIAAPSFAHDGTAIYFGSMRSGSWQVWRIAAAGADPQQITTAGAYAAVESNDGRWLYFSRFDGRGLWRRPTKGGAQQSLAADVAPEDWPNWGLWDGGYFFIARPDDDDPVLMVCEDGQAPRVAARLSEQAWSGVAMSRDGSHVLYAHADHRDANIVGIQFVR